MINDSHVVVKIKWLSCQFFITNIHMCVAVILIGDVQCVSPGSSNRWHSVQRNVFCFMHL